MKTPAIRPIPALTALTLLAALAALILYVYSAAIPAAAQTATDYDDDGDNLIEITTLDQLNAVRWDLNGNGVPDAAANTTTYAAAFPGGNIADTSTPYMGCAATCAGYELDANLDFAADEMAVTSTDAYPNWTPIGPSSGTGYSAQFNGNGRTISRLTITGAVRSGLFDTLAAGGVIRDLGMIAPSVSAGPPAGQHMGVITASNGGTITASYVRGGSVTATNANTYAGGLSGGNTGTIQASYSTAAVSGLPSVNMGGLSGISGGAIIASYAAGPVSGGSTGGGLVGLLWAGAATITDSHCDTSVHSTPRNCVGGYNAGANTSITGNPHTTAELQTPTGYTNMYRNWNIDLDADTFPDNPWNFGTTTTYPTLKTPTQRQAVEDYDSDNDNLIDIDSLYQLNAIRHDLNGDGRPDAVGSYVAYAGAFPDGNISDTSTPYMGCAATCTGYELTESLNFDLDGDGQVGVSATSTDPYPNFAPIGGSYTATFDGNGRTISHLTFNAAGSAGLFHTLGSGGVIRNVGMITPQVSNTGNAVYIGSLAGVIAAGGAVSASYAQGGTVNVGAANSFGGGLLGLNSGAVRASYATEVTISATSSSAAGGLAGAANGAFTASYAASAVSSGLNRGGFVAFLKRRQHHRQLLRLRQRRNRVRRHRHRYRQRHAPNAGAVANPHRLHRHLRQLEHRH